MSRHLSTCVKLVAATLFIICGVYTLSLWLIGQAIFPDKAAGSLVRGPDGNPVGSRLIAQPFTKAEYFHPRPSAAAYNAAASGATNWGASNYLLRARVAAHSRSDREVPRAGPRRSSSSAPTSRPGSRRISIKDKPRIVAQWADAHGGLAQAWVKADASHAAYVDEWAKPHQAEVAQWIKNNPQTPEPAAADLAVIFFDSFSKEHPGQFPSAVRASRPTARPRPRSSRSRKARTSSRPSSTCGARSTPTPTCKTSRPTW